MDGKQYIELFKEYLKQKSEDIKIEHVSFSLLNIEKLNLTLFDSLGKISFLENIGEISSLIKDVAQAIKRAKHK